MFSNCIERLGHKKKTKNKKQKQNKTKQQQANKEKPLYIKTVVETFLDDVYLVMTTI